MFKVIDSEIFTIYNLINWIQGNNELSCIIFNSSNFYYQLIKVLTFYFKAFVDEMRLELALCIDRLSQIRDRMV